MGEPFYRTNYALEFDPPAIFLSRSELTELGGHGRREWSTAQMAPVRIGDIGGEVGLDGVAGEVNEVAGMEVWSGFGDADPIPGRRILDEEIGEQFGRNSLIGDGGHIAEGDDCGDMHGIVAVGLVAGEAANLCDGAERGQRSSGRRGEGREQAESQ